jgi:hypothetical protein
MAVSLTRQKQRLAVISDLKCTIVKRNAVEGETTKDIKSELKVDKKFKTDSL